jgi:hypothetical protein
MDRIDVYLSAALRYGGDPPVRVHLRPFRPPFVLVPGLCS